MPDLILDLSMDLTMDPIPDLNPDLIPDLIPDLMIDLSKDLIPDLFRDLILDLNHDVSVDTHGIDFSFTQSECTQLARSSSNWRRAYSSRRSSAPCEGLTHEESQCFPR